MVKNSRFADKKFCKLFKCVYGEFFVIPVDFIVAEDKRKCIKFFA